MAKMSLGDWLAQQDAAQAPAPRESQQSLVPPRTEQQEPPPSEYGGWGDKGLAFVNGFNNGAYMGAPNLAQSRLDPEGFERTKARNQEHPYTNAAGQIVGGTVTGIATMPARVMNGLNAAGRVGLSAVQGGIQGGTTRFNEALANGGGYTDALWEGGKGALGGALGGAIFQGGGEIVGDVAGRMVASRMTPAPRSAGPNTGPNRFAADTIDDSMRATGSTPSRVEADIAHLGPQGVMADHPTMAPAIGQLNRAGGEGHEMFANFATERVAGAPERRAADFRNPQPTFQSEMAARQQAAGQRIDQAIDTFPQDVQIDALRLRNELADLGHGQSTYGKNTAGDEVLKLAEGLPQQIDPRTLHNTKRNMDKVLNHDGGDHPALSGARRVIDSHLDNLHAPYDDANQAFQHLKLQEDAYNLARSKVPDQNEINALHSQAGTLSRVQNPIDDMTTAFERGARDRINNGIMERETVFQRTQNNARRPVQDENPSVDMGTAAALNAAHGPGAMLTAAGTVASSRIANNLFKPGEEQGKALAKFLQLTGDERAKVLREIAERGGEVRNKGKAYANYLKNTLRGAGITGGQMGMNALDTPEWLR